jgi:hypothetical protein
MPRAEPLRAAKASRASPRFAIDRVWLLRGGLALAVVGFILVLAKVSLMLFGTGNTRLERYERASEQRAAMQTVVSAKAAASG